MGVQVVESADVSENSPASHTNAIMLTSSDGHPPLQDADVELQGQLGR